MCEWPSLLLSALYLTNKLSYIFSWLNSPREYMSFQSETFVSGSEPTTLCGYICRSNWTHLFLILNQLLFALTPYWCLSPDIMAICLTRPRLNPTIYRYHVHHCTTYKVSETWNVILLLYHLDMIWFKCTFCGRFNGNKNLTVFLV